MIRFDSGREAFQALLDGKADFATSVLFAEGGMLAQIVDFAPREIVPALARGDVDAAVMFPSLYAHAKHALGDDYREVIIKGYASHFLVATRPEMLASRATEVVILLQGLKRADAAIRGDGPAAQAAIVRAMGPQRSVKCGRICTTT